MTFTLRTINRLLSAWAFLMAYGSAVFTSQMPMIIRFWLLICAAIGLVYAAWAWFPQVDEVQR